MQAIAGVADECCKGRLVAITEGGYDLAALAASLRTSLRALMGESAGDVRPEGSRARGEATIAAVTPHLSKYWKL
jgi:acetoin utilization deacetylase AcuC-like enzyme